MMWSIYGHPALAGKLFFVGDLPRLSDPHPSNPPPTSAFEKWRRKAALITGLGLSQDERLAHLQISHLEDCESKEALMNPSEYFIPKTFHCFT